MSKKFTAFLMLLLIYVSLGYSNTDFSQDIPFTLKDGDIIKIIDVKSNKKISCMFDNEKNFNIVTCDAYKSHNGHQLFRISKINKKSKMLFNNDLIELDPLYALENSNKFIELHNKKLAVISTWHRGNQLSQIGITPMPQKNISLNKKYSINKLFILNKPQNNRGESESNKPIFINDIVEIRNKETNQKLAISHSAKESKCDSITLSHKPNFFRVETAFKPELDQIENISFQEMLATAQNQANYAVKINSYLSCLKIFSPTIYETNKQKLVKDLKNLFDTRNKQNPQQLCLLRVLLSFAVQKTIQTDYRNIFENLLSTVTNELYPFALKSGDIIKIATIGSNKKRAWLNKNYDNNIEVNIDPYFNFQEEASLFKLKSSKGKQVAINYYDEIELIPLYAQVKNFTQQLNPYVKLATNKIFKDRMGRYLLSIESSNFSSPKNIFYLKPFPALNALKGPVISNTKLEIWNKATKNKLYISQNKLVSNFQNKLPENLEALDLFVIEKAINLRVGFGS